MQVVEVVRLVGFQQADIGSLQEGIAGTAPPDIGLRVVGFGAQLGERLAGRLFRLLHLDAGGFLELAGGHVAPGLIRTADGIDRLRRDRRSKHRTKGQCGGKHDRGFS